ncbi:hypothetical protein [Candidatus Neptunichlamydia sp. REUL1]|uniref:hypothetical protein n=1 Tax=Candidatus Neptunichlamydia sp. REUL1 TaxID=3064277 RepID=UPI00292FC0B3|nr:hypothetical protein [Candidatus Neptunochlamydia sp. REUL1]
MEKPRASDTHLFNAMDMMPAHPSPSRGQLKEGGGLDKRDHFKDRGMFHKLMSVKVLEDKGWLAAAMILGLLASYPLVVKPLHKVSTDMLSKMRSNLKTGAI